MLSKEEIKRYSRHLVMPELGETGQQKMKNAKALVIGAGGLGCPVLQYLAAAGVGTLGVVDFDKVEESNLQRQILFSINDIGKSKAEAAKEKLLGLNPLISVEAFDKMLTAANALEIFSGFDLVIDGSDNFATRYLVGDACVILNKPLVFGSIFKFEGQVSVFNYAGGPTYRCLYPEPPAAGEIPSCSEAGVLGVLPGICGTLMANEAIKIITGIGNVLKGRLLSFNSLTLQFDLFKFEANSENKNLRVLTDYDLFCGSVPEISVADLQIKINSGADFQLIDVREEEEYTQRNIGGVLIPLGSLVKNLNRVSPDKEIVVHCASGARSKKAAAILRDNGFKRVYNLKNGLLDL